jgi:bacterioferritin
MGTKGREIVGLDIDLLLKKLNTAFADEWLAYYQYWIGAKIAVGPMRGAVVAELIEHAGDELRHADMLTERIIQLGGTPLLSPNDWYDEGHCKYLEPTDHAVGNLLQQNIKAEQCAIGYYQDLIEMVKDKDPITYNIVLEILGDEVEHEEDLQALQEDMQVMLKTM